MTNPIYPVYVVSKGRWARPLTARALERIGVPYRIVVEPPEYPHYAQHIAPDKILQLPFANLGQGSIPARNWIWEHSISEGHARHWILDDNINDFYRYNHNRTYHVFDGTIFRVAEIFTDRYENVGLSGFQYMNFGAQDKRGLPFLLNTRIYSCILIDNALQFRWRGRYNEDTDLSLRVLKTGYYCTVLFVAFLIDKMQTMVMRGGNTDELYQRDGRLRMAQELVLRHPDVVRIGWRWGRWQHVVDYSPFKNNRLIYKPGVRDNLASDINEFGMELIDGTP